MIVQRFFFLDLIVLLNNIVDNFMQIRISFAPGESLLCMSQANQPKPDNGGKIFLPAVSPSQSCTQTAKLVHCGLCLKPAEMVVYLVGTVSVHEHTAPACCHGLICLLSRSQNAVIVAYCSCC